MSRPVLEPPGINSLLLVDVGEPGSEVALAVPSRVEGEDGADLLIAAPRWRGDLSICAGTPVLLRWTGRRGVYELAGELVDVLRGRVTRWRVRPVGSVQTTERRRFTRAHISAPIAVVPVADDLVRVVKGWLADLSEGGLRARLEGTPLAVDSPVEVHLELESVPLVLSGQVLRTRDVEVTSGTYEVVIVIDPGVHAKRIRRVVLRQQQLARRGGEA